MNALEERKKGKATQACGEKKEPWHASRNPVTRKKEEKGKERPPPAKGEGEKAARKTLSQAGIGLGQWKRKAGGYFLIRLEKRKYLVIRSISR